MSFNLPPTCPFTIRVLFSTPTIRHYLIREHDHYDQYPNIYAKAFYTAKNSLHPDLIVLSDTGTGLIQEVTNSSTSWTIATLLASTINPHHSAPYIILTTHCHFDHIMGIQRLLDAGAKVTVYSSSHNKSYLTPWTNLQKHSHCEQFHMTAPCYDIRWVGDGESLSLKGSLPWCRRDLGITIMHTPGHTPDSLTWYDSHARTLNVGDMFYERESDETQSGSGGRWEREPPQPVIFVRDSEIADWKESTQRALEFVRAQNEIFMHVMQQDGHGTYVGCEVEELKEQEGWNWVSVSDGGDNVEEDRVRLCAAHVTASTDAERAIMKMQDFMDRVLRDEVPRKKVDDSIEHKGGIWLWDDCLCKSGRALSEDRSCRFSVQAPLDLIRGTV